MRMPMLLISCLLFAFVPSRGHPQFLNLPRFPPPVDVKVNPKLGQPKPNLETTVEEVESILRSNPSLPRLTRGEILDLLENITREDSKRDPKAVMLVMPYTPEGENQKNIEELFTKPPVTHIIGPRLNGEEGGVRDSVNEIRSEALDTNQVSSTKPTKTRGRPFRKNPTVTTSTTTTTSPSQDTSTPPQRDSTPVQFVEKSRRRRPPTSRTSTTTTTEQPEVTPPRRRPTRRRPTTFRYSNHKYPDDSTTSSTTLPSSGIRVIKPPNLDPIVINEDLLMTEDRRNEVVVGSEGNPVQFEEDKESYDYVKGPTKKPVKKYQPIPKLPSPLDSSEIQEMLSFLASLPTTTTTTTTSTTAVPDISDVADNLSPDMRELLMNFGLIPDPREATAGASQVVESYSQEKPEVKPESYVGFKPLPDDDASKSEMEELLAKFGLGRTVGQQGNLKVHEDHSGISMEMVPEQFKGVLEDIGLSTREGKMIRSEAPTNLAQQRHVFSPQKTHNVTRAEIEKLNALIGIFKQLGAQNGSANISDIDQNELKEIITSFNEADRLVPLDEQSAPNPIQYDHGLSKNEVKRQEPTSTTTTTTTTTTSAPITTQQAEVVEDKGPSIKDLEDSFGGTTESSTSTTTEQAPETTTGLRRTGFYYLVDWNTFLDIDDQKGKRVNLRFQPTIGDPKRFYSVSVP